ncbi:MAG: type II toxin-antitoxin system VapC family toxin [Blastocatellia bacterium]|nr:type II toxin-antitoxin system VapC family toxin [Blastocatellia bacterium]
MYILDTDHMSLLERKTSHEAQRLFFRLSAINDKDYGTTIISVEEQMKGWLALLASARTVEKQIEFYGRLKNALYRYNKIQLFDFDFQAANIFTDLQKRRLRIGTMDLKIAAIAIANNATLLSRNLKDFGKIPTLQVDDWAA